ncbi:MAG: hypothetical protein ACUVSK_02525 [Desulfotomaculales bacterium]
MDELTLHLEPEITARGLEQLRSALAGRDRINVVLEAADAHQAGAVLEILRSSGFSCQSRGSHDGKHYYLLAKKSRKNKSEEE